MSAAGGIKVGEMSEGEIAFAVVGFGRTVFSRQSLPIS
jgi:hypothetical protein